MTKNKLTYRDAGVDIDKGNALVHRIKSITKNHLSSQVLNGIGGFGALFELPLHKYQNPILVSSTDGVGTKLKLAFALNKHDTIGIDLVAMSVNDILTVGAKPLFFLDYYATGKLDIDCAEDVIKGIVQGCTIANTMLIGGETAEMPDMYAKNEYDLAGFCVGIVEKSKIIDGKNVKKDDVLIGITSSGIHSNGYSLIRKILEKNQISLDSDFYGKPLGNVLLEPTKIYVKSIHYLLKSISIHAIAHITGGGLLENIPRVIPQGLCAEIRIQSWEIPTIFKWIEEQGNISTEEMLRTFNCGIGMIICVPQNECKRALNLLKKAGETAYPIGKIVKSSQDKIRFIF